MLNFPHYPKSEKLASYNRVLRYAAKGTASTVERVAVSMSYVFEAIAVELSQGRVVRLPGFGMFGVGVRVNQKKSRRRDGKYCYPAFFGSQALRNETAMADVERADLKSSHTYRCHHTRCYGKPVTYRVFQHQEQIRRSIHRQEKALGYGKFKKRKIVRIKRRRG